MCCKVELENLRSNNDKLVRLSIWWLVKHFQGKNEVQRTLCNKFCFQIKKGPKNIFQGSMGKFEVSRIMSSLGHLFGALPNTFDNKNEVPRKSCKVYIPRQKKKSQERMIKKFEVSRKMSSLGLMNSQYNIARFNWKIWCLKKEKFMTYLMVCPTFQKQEWKGLQKFN